MNEGISLVPLDIVAVVRLSIHLHLPDECIPKLEAFTCGLESFLFNFLSL